MKKLPPKKPVDPKTGKSFDLFIRINAVGEFGVGKTQLFRKFLEDDNWPKNDLFYRFNDYTWIYKIMRLNNCDVAIECVDTYGSEEKNALTSGYFRNIQGTLLVYDITSRNSFKKLKKWVDTLIDFNPPIHLCPIFVIGTKIDLESKREVLYEEGLEFANKHNYIYREVSSTTNENIQECFSEFISKIVDIHKPPSEKKTFDKCNIS